MINTIKQPKTQLTESLTFAFVGNPNVGKSTLFNMLTGDNQHTGNWAGKTVEIAKGKSRYANIPLNLIDLPGTYSLTSSSPEEIVTENYIKSKEYDCIIIVANSTFLERNLLLTLQVLSKTQKAVLYLNMADEAKQKNISIDTDELSLQLGIPVIMGSAKNKKGIKELIATSFQVATGNKKTFHNKELERIYLSSENNEQETEQLYSHIRRISSQVIKQKGSVYTNRDKKLDKLFTSPVTGIPIMLLIFAFIFWLTAFGANYPSQWLSTCFNTIKLPLINLCRDLNFSSIISGILLDGIYTTVSWVISVMLPPALIFFPLFAILEDFGYLPRVAFNLDRIFKKSGANGKLALTMLMGFGCNTCGVMGCRIINSGKERIVSAVTNSFIPCNGRLPTLFAVISIFFSVTGNGTINSLITAAIMIALVMLSFLVTLTVSCVLSKTVLKGSESDLMMELPPYRKPAFFQIIKNTFRTKIMYVLSRAIIASVPAGIVIWTFANTKIADTSILNYVITFLNPFGEFIGLDGTIITGFLLGFPANEIVLPAILMGYLNTGTLTEYYALSQLGDLLTARGWTLITAICVCIFCLFHFPCSTTCFAIKKETKSNLWTIMSILIPLIIGMLFCLVVSSFAKIIS